MRQRSALSVPLLACGALLASALPVQAATDAAVSVGTSFVLAGHGNGHGHGMSQYGARGAAIEGRSASQILNFYYPGTYLSTDTRVVKVLITADDDHSANVLPEAGLKVTDLTAKKTFTLPSTGQEAWRLRLVSGKTRMEYLKDGWHTYLPGGRALVGSGQLASAAGALTLQTPEGPRRYRGGIRLSAGNVVNVLTLDNYTRGVVPREMPTLWQAAAVRAQAIAARTYASRAITDNPNRSYHLCDTSQCQVYGGLGDEESGGNAAVAYTAGKILKYQGEPAFAQFSASNGGYTSAGSLPYLPGKKDPYDATPSNPYTNWHQTITATTVEKAFPALGTLRKVQVLARDSTGRRVTSIKLTGTTTSTTITGDRMRTIFGLRSTYFRVTKP